MTVKLCVVAPNLGLSFIDRHVHGFPEYDTVAVTLFSHYPHKEFWPPKAPVFDVQRWKSRLRVRAAARLFGDSIDDMAVEAVGRFWRKRGVSVVLGQFMDNFLPYARLAEQMGLPYVVQAHGIDVSASLQQPGMAESYQVYQSAAAILTRSEHQRRRLIEIGLPAHKIHVNPGGVDVPTTLPSAPEGAGHRILAVGRMVPKKGPMLLLEAFRLAAQQDDRLTLDYVGDGPMFSAVQQYVLATGLHDRVRLHGTVAEAHKRQLLESCGVFAQHSVTAPDGDEEGLPAALQEAMAQGMAVVATRHAGIPEAVEDGVSGVLVNEGDVKAMADAFVFVTPQARAMGKAAFERVRRGYRWEDERARLRAVLRAASRHDDMSGLTLCS